MYQSKGEKNITIQQVKDYFIKHKTASKIEIAKVTQLSLATITNILQELQSIHFIKQVDDYQSTGGRKAKGYRICANYMLFGLISLCVIKQRVELKAQIVNLDEEIIFYQEYSYSSLFLNDLIECLENLKASYTLASLAISIPAIVHAGIISKCDIETLEGCPLQSELESQLSLSVTIENDVNTAMLGYIEQHQIKQHSIAFIYQPDNHHSGCGQYINGAIVYGATHFAGELGFLPNGSLAKQVQLLKENPSLLLVKQASSVIAVMNPHHMVIYAPSVKKDEFLNGMKKAIPVKHHPVFEFIDSIDLFIFKGLLELCIEKTRFKIRRTNNER